MNTGTGNAELATALALATAPETDPDAEAEAELVASATPISILHVSPRNPNEIYLQQAITVKFAQCTLKLRLPM